ncbi:TAR DNA-binding protein 43 [Armadillidium vulgare]|nr:TAR DNA-binding protein 43 [Armadillidium vulgare]
MEMENDDIIELREVSEREAAAEKFERKYKLLENEFLSKIEETPNPIIEPGYYQDRNNSFIEDKEYEDAFASLGKNKKKSDKLCESYMSKTKSLENFMRCSDLIAFRLPCKTTEKELRECSELYCEILMTQVEKDPQTGQSKGFDSICCASCEVQQRFLDQRHMIDGRVEIRRIRCGVYYDRLREVSEREAAAEKFERKYKLLENEFLSKIEETPNPIIEPGYYQDRNNSFIEDKEYEDAFASLGKYKRNSDELCESYMSKTKSLENFMRCSDLIAFRLPCKTTDKKLRECSELYCEILMTQVEKDPQTGQSKVLILSVVQFAMPTNLNKYLCYAATPLKGTSYCFSTFCGNSVSNTFDEFARHEFLKKFYLQRVDICYNCMSNFTKEKNLFLIHLFFFHNCFVILNSEGVMLIKLHGRQKILNDKVKAINAINSVFNVLSSALISSN